MLRISQLRLLVVGLLVVPALLCPESVDAGDVTVGLDQYQTAQNAWGMVGSAGEVGEVFTPAQSGYLAGVSLYLERYAPHPTTPAVRIIIQTVTSEGLPSGTSIGSGWIAADDIPVNGGWVDAEITGVFVTAGTRYALLASTVEDGIVLWHSAIGDVKPYARGYWVDKASGVWEKILTNQDWTFKTYVAPDTLDQNQSQTSGTGAGTRALGTTPVGQTFTVGTYGLFDRVSVYLTNSSASPGPIVVTVLKVTSSGLPAIGSQVASGTIHAESIPKAGYRGWASAIISPFVVTPGTKYALLLSTNVSGPQWVLVSDVYSGGTGVIRNGTSWTTTTYDFAFQSYVLPPILDQYQTQWSESAPLRYGWPVGQYFTPRVSGILDRVSVVMDNDYMSATGPDVAVGIYYLSGVLIGSGTIPYTSVPFWFNGSTPAWIDASITGIPLTAGTQYLLALQTDASYAHLEWYYGANSYSGGNALMNHQSWPWYDMAFKTYVLPMTQIVTAPGPGGITPCLNGVCPAASGGLTPADLTDGVTSHFQFQVRRDGTARGILNFSDPRPNGIALQGCTTQSAACALTVSAVICTDAQSMIIGGTYTPRGGTARRYRLTVTGASDGPGTFSLTSGDYTFTHTLDGIVSVTCPPIGGH